MAMYNYGVGGNEIKVDANEAIQEIQENRSLLVSQLTSDESMVPEVVRGLKTIEDVFRGIFSLLFLFSMKRRRIILLMKNFVFRL